MVQNRIGDSALSKGRACVGARLRMCVRACACAHRQSDGVNKWSRGKAKRISEKPPPGTAESARFAFGDPFHVADWWSAQSQGKVGLSRPPEEVQKCRSSLRHARGGHGTASAPRPGPFGALPWRGPSNALRPHGSSAGVPSVYSGVRTQYLRQPSVPSKHQQRSPSAPPHRLQRRSSIRVNPDEEWPPTAYGVDHDVDHGVDHDVDHGGARFPEAGTPHPEPTPATPTRRLGPTSWVIATRLHAKCYVQFCTNAPRFLSA